MKNRILKSVFLFGLLISKSISLLAQSNEILDNFSVFENGGKVYLNWTVSSGSTCDGIEIFHSLDEIHFNSIGDIPGICGSSSESVSYSFVHESPNFNSVNNYRLRLGLIGFSDVISLTLIETKEDGYRVFPNPFKENSTLFFKNPKKQIYILTIYDQFGKTVSKQSGFNDKFILNRDDLTSGLFLFTLTPEDDTQITGKFLVR